ncbi:MAG TPA: GNAT family N-acetyltransferase [Ktedonosporobacter sp.]|nr:GNAT family N-acetyltransferase [Ktedonosporobacter sp.]
MGNDDTQKQHLPIPGSDDKLPKPADLAPIFNEVTTARLVLRRLQPTDGPAMFRVHGDPETYRYSPATPHPDLATSEEMLRSCLHDWETSGFGLWAAMLPQQEKIIGFGGVEPMVWRERDVLNLYYRFTPSAWGQGYATELARTAVSLARTYLPQWPVVARTRAYNLPSIRTAERAGLLRRPDLDTEHVVFALGWTPIEDPGSSL